MTKAAAPKITTRRTRTTTKKTPALRLDAAPDTFWSDGELSKMKRADKRRAEREAAYNRRDMFNMALVTGFAVALMYTSLWLIYVMAS